MCTIGAGEHQSIPKVGVEHGRCRSSLPRDLRRTARRGLAIYFSVVVVLSGGLEAYFIFINPDAFGILFWTLALMWNPALASVIARLVLREDFSDVSFRLGATHRAVRGTRLV